jgi:hypothetical protein
MDWKKIKAPKILLGSSIRQLKKHISSMLAFRPKLNIGFQ